jgi:hypothetical protein
MQETNVAMNATIVQVPKRIRVIGAKATSVGGRLVSTLRIVDNSLSPQ